MNKAVVNQYMPDYISPPGETLLETLEEREMSQEDLAERVGISQKTINEILTGKAAITTDLAWQLEQVLGIPASFWNNRERNYRDALARQSEPQRLNFHESKGTSKFMTQQPIKPIAKPSNEKPSSEPSKTTTQTMNIVDEIIKTIDGLKQGLQTYPIRKLVNHAEEFGPYLKQQRLETNQVRKFLDAVNRLKADLAQEGNFAKIETEVVLLKPKLAYAAARQRAAKPLSDVMSAAIDQVHSQEDFERLVQLIESIIAYHKAEGGK